VGSHVSTYLVWRIRQFDIGIFRPSLDKVDSHGSVETQQRIQRERKPLLLVRLQRDNGQPNVEGSESQS